MRWASLYLRSHRVPAAVLITTALTASVWALTAAFSDAPAAGPKLVLLTVTVAVAALATTLGTRDDALDRTAALPWPPRRMAHLIGICAVTTALLGLTLATSTRFGTLAFVIRDSAGLTGLIAISATLLGTHRAWFPAVAWAMPVIAFADPADRHHVLTWMLQPTDTAAATFTAAVLAVVGVTVYALVGPPRRPASEPGDE